MSLFWTVFIAVITLASLAGCAALLFFYSKDFKHIPNGELSDHEWDGIQELNNPLPKWWSYMFWATIFFAIFYLLAYGIGGFNGFFGWKSADLDVRNLTESREQYSKEGLNQYARELARADERFGATIRAFTHDINTNERLSIETIAQNSEALKAGQRLFLQNCAQCHGSDARGQLGFPNLTDDDWLWGNTAADIKHALIYGRNGIMAPWLEVLGQQGIEDVVSYTLSLSGRKVNILEAERGKALFAVCAACHGMDGKGNYALGAPNLTDNIWQYGGSRKAVVETLTYGRQSVMPAWKDILDEDKIDLLSAYVWSLSNQTN